jgi:hypothetical protein
MNSLLPVGSRERSDYEKMSPFCVNLCICLATAAAYAQKTERISGEVLPREFLAHLQWESELV